MKQHFAIHSMFQVGAGGCDSPAQPLLSFDLTSLMPRQAACIEPRAVASVLGFSCSLCFACCRSVYGHWTKLSSSLCALALGCPACPATSLFSKCLCTCTCHVVVAGQDAAERQQQPPQRRQREQVHARVAPLHGGRRPAAQAGGRRPEEPGAAGGRGLFWLWCGKLQLLRAEMAAWVLLFGALSLGGGGGRGGRLRCVV